MRKKLLSMLLALCMVFTLLPMTASAAASTLEIGSGTYALDETGLNAATAAANDGDTISFTGSGTIALTNDILINKSITLDLNKHHGLKLTAAKTKSLTGTICYKLIYTSYFS